MKPRKHLVTFCLAYLSLSFPARADWSQEIVLYEIPPGLAEGPMECALAVDSAENVHIAFEFGCNPTHGRDGLMYMKLDDHGHVLVPQTLLNDTSWDVVATNPKIVFFGSDSLWVCWDRGYEDRTGMEYDSFVVRCLDLDGHIEGPIIHWPDLPFSFNNIPWETIVVDSSRRAIAIYTDRNERMRCVVQNPDGSRIMDNTVIWDAQERRCDSPDAYMDASDSLQLIWRQYRFDPYTGTSAYARRMDISHAFDIAHIEDSTVISPYEQGIYWGEEGLLRPVDDSLLTFHLRGPGDAEFWNAYYLKVVRRSDYSMVSQVRSNDGGWHSADHEPNGAVSAVAYAHEHGPGTPWQMRFRRYSFPSLTLLQDDFFKAQADSGLRVTAYAVSPGGTRHLLYVVDWAPNHAKLVYRYWRADLRTSDSRPASTKPQFVVSPNPVTEGLSIEGPLSTVKSVVIYNILGQQVLKLKPETRTGQRMVLPEVGHLPSGTYFLHIETLHGSSVQKILIGR